MKLIDEFKKLPKKEKCTCIVKYGCLCAFIVCSLVLIVESLMPGSVSSQHSSAVGNLIDAPVNKTVETVSLKISKKGLPSEVNVGDSFTLVPVFEPKNATYKQVEWEVTGGAKVTNDVVTFTEEGKATVKLIDVHDRTLSDTVEFDVKKIAVESIEIICPSAMNIGDNVFVAAKIMPENATYTGFSVTSTSDCIEIEDNMIVAVKEGGATVTVTSNDGEFVDSAVITISSVPVTHIAFTLDGKELNEITLDGKSANLSLSVAPENYTDKIVWETEGDVNLRFNSLTSFSVMPLSAETTVIARANSTQVAVLKVHAAPVSEPVTGFSVEDLTLGLTEGGSIACSSYEKKCAYELLEGDAVSINELGLITALKKGVAKVKVTCGEFSDVAAVTVSDLMIRTLSIARPSDEPQIGKTYRLNYDFEPRLATNREIAWSVDDDNLAHITQDGAVKFVKAGSVTVTASTESGVTSSITLTARNVLGLKSLKAFGFDDFDGFEVGTAKLKLNSSVRLSADFEQGVTYRSLTLTSSDPDVLSVFGTTATALKVGSATLTVTYWDGNEANTPTVYNVEITVLKQMMSDFVGNWGYRVRKGIGHFGAFLVTGIFCSVAFMMIFKRKYLSALLVPVAGFSLAGLTELLQMITPNRGPAFADVMLDFEGFCIAAVPIVIGFLTVALVRYIKSKKNKGES